MSEKIIGYTLLFLGLLIMAVSAVNIYMVFTNKTKPFEVFNIESNNDSQAGSIDVNDLIKQLQSGNSNAKNPDIPQPKIDILPPEVLNHSLNLTTHFFLMSFVVGFGYKLASLGVQLVRPIKVKLRSNIQQSGPPQTNPVT